MPFRGFVEEKLCIPLFLMNLGSQQAPRQILEFSLSYIMCLSHFTSWPLNPRHATCRSGDVCMLRRMGKKETNLQSNVKFCFVCSKCEE